MAEVEDLDAMWKAVNDELHRGELIPGLWEAAASVKPLAIDGNALVLGVPVQKAGLASHLQSTRHRNHVQNIIEKVTGKRLECQVIEGDTLEAWERRKEFQAAREAQAGERLEQKRARQDAVGAWNRLREQLTVKYGEMVFRRSPRVMAQYMMEVLPLVRETEDQLVEAGLADDDAHERNLSRVLDKIATQCNIPSTMVALEYVKLAEK